MPLQLCPYRSSPHVILFSDPVQAGPTSGTDAADLADSSLHSGNGHRMTHSVRINRNSLLKAALVAGALSVARARGTAAAATSTTTTATTFFERGANGQDMRYGADAHAWPASARHGPSPPGNRGNTDRGDLGGGGGGGHSVGWGLRAMYHLTRLCAERGWSLVPLGTGDDGQYALTMRSHAAEADRDRDGQRERKHRDGETGAIRHRTRPSPPAVTDLIRPTHGRQVLAATTTTATTARLLPLLTLHPTPPPRPPRCTASFSPPCQI